MDQSPSKKECLLYDLEGGDPIVTGTIVRAPATVEQDQDTRVKKKKEYKDDTSSYEGPAILPADAARRANRARRHAFRKFTKNNHASWMRFNIIILLASLGFGIGNYFVV